MTTKEFAEFLQEWSAEFQADNDAALAQQQQEEQEQQDEN